MNAKFSLKDRSMIRFATALVAVALAWAVVRSQAAQPVSVSTNTYGSGKQFKTIIERQAQGELTAEDLHQASLLTSQLLLHLNEAAQHLADSRSDIHTPVHASWLHQIEIYFSIVQRKALTPNDFSCLNEVEDRLLRFQEYYESMATPFDWRFTRNDLAKLTKKFLAQPAPLRLAA